MNSLVIKEEIEKRRMDRLQSKCTSYPRNNPVASSIEECTRRMYYDIKNWKDRPTVTPELQARFEEGNRQESYVIRELMELGFTITENNPPPFEIIGRNKEVIQRGKIDGKISYNGVKLPFEIKSITPMVFNKITTSEDFKKFAWMKKYIYQLNIYLYANNEPEGLFILVDMQGHWKILPLSLDLELVEEALQKSEEVVDAIKGNRSIPNYTKDYSNCQRCWAYKLLCNPSVDFGDGVQILDNLELEEKLKRRDQLREYRDEYEAIDSDVKGTVGKEELHALCGNYEIIVKKGKQVRKATEEKTIETTRVSITKIKGEQNEKPVAE